MLQNLSFELLELAAFVAPENVRFRPGFEEFRAANECPSEFFEVANYFAQLFRKFIWTLVCGVMECFLFKEFEEELRSRELSSEGFCIASFREGFLNFWC